MYNEVKSVMSIEEFDKHFTPPYSPWQQRFCLAPGGDFFKPIREGKATMVTGHIDKFTANGIQMKDGQHVDADFIVFVVIITTQVNNVCFRMVNGIVTCGPCPMDAPFGNGKVCHNE